MTGASSLHGLREPMHALLREVVHHDIIVPRVRQTWPVEETVPIRPDEIAIRSRVDEVAPFVETVQRRADAEREALGVLPSCAYQEGGITNRYAFVFASVSRLRRAIGLNGLHHSAASLKPTLVFRRLEPGSVELAVLRAASHCSWVRPRDFGETRRFVLLSASES